MGILSFIAGFLREKIIDAKIEALIKPVHEKVTTKLTPLTKIILFSKGRNRYDALI